MKMPMRHQERFREQSLQGQKLHQPNGDVSRETIAADVVETRGIDARFLEHQSNDD